MFLVVIIHYFKRNLTDHLVIKNSLEIVFLVLSFCFISSPTRFSPTEQLTIWHDTRLISFSLPYVFGNLQAHNVTGPNGSHGSQATFCRNNFGKDQCGGEIEQIPSDPAAAKGTGHSKEQLDWWSHIIFFFLVVKPCGVRQSNNTKAAALRSWCACLRRLKGLTRGHLENDHLQLHCFNTICSHTEWPPQKNWCGKVISCLLPDKQKYSHRLQVHDPFTQPADLIWVVDKLMMLVYLCLGSSFSHCDQMESKWDCKMFILPHYQVEIESVQRAYLLNSDCPLTHFTTSAHVS